LDERRSPFDPAFNARDDEHWDFVEMLGQVGRGIHHPLRFRWCRGRIILDLRFPVEIANGDLLPLVGDHQEMPPLLVSGRRRLKGQLEALLQQRPLHRPGEIQAPTHGPGG
jgi:hypothetical protein